MADSTEARGETVREPGLVVRVDGREATVVVRRRSACSSCGKCIGSLHPPQDLTVVALNRAGARQGEHVVIELQDIGVVKAAALVYALPLVAATAAFAVGALVARLGGLPVEPLGLVAAVLGLLVAFVGLGVYDRRMTAAGRHRPVIVEVCPAEVGP
ncbi:MAG: SoxR reducing system RseC family protein [Bacillota bacterium]